jgi:TetR/AcrR family transcriptional repressor of nem operon
MRDRRIQIIDAAAALIRRHGYTQTSVEDVIREARLCGKGHFYHYFKSKEALGYAVLQRQFEQFAEHGLSILRDPMSDPLERLNRFIDAVVAAQAERGCPGGCPFANLAGEMADAHDGFRRQIQTVFERWTDQMQALLWEARPRLADGVDIGRLARFIVATLEGALLMARVRRETGALEGIAEDLKRFIAMHVRGRAAAPPVAAGAAGAA